LTFGLAAILQQLKIRQEKRRDRKKKIAKHQQRLIGVYAQHGGCDGEPSQAFIGHATLAMTMDLYSHLFKIRPSSARNG
jgi:hypothetical protein